MACEKCTPFMKYADQNITFSEFEALFEVISVTNYPMACHGEAICRECKHLVVFNYEEILLVKLYIEKW